jgi:hypothetical protein
MSGEDAPRPYLENLLVLEIKTNKQIYRLNWDVRELPLHILRRGLCSRVDIQAPHLQTV